MKTLEYSLVSSVPTDLFKFLINNQSKFRFTPISMSNRKFLAGGNWKMNGDKASIDGIIKFLNEGENKANAGMLI